MVRIDAAAGEPVLLRLGRWVLFAGCTLAALSLLAALLPVDLGVWPRFEPPAMVLYIAAAIAGLGLLAVWRDERDLVERSIVHPFVLVALFIFVLSAALAPLAEFPWLSIFGAPLIGEGALRFLAMAVLFAAILVLRANARARMLLLAIVLLVSLVGSVSFFFAIRTEFASLDKLGYLVGPAWIGAWFLVPERHVRMRFVAAFLSIIPILILSTNTTVISAVLILAIPGTILVHVLLAQNRVAVWKIRTVAVAVVAMVPFLALVAVWIIPELTDALPSITSRKYMFQVLIAAFQADPSIALWGQGWGEISITADRFRTFSEAILWDGSWDGFDRNVSHTQNQIVEALFGAGLLAAIAVLALLVTPVLTAAPRNLPSAFFVASVYAGAGATWPQVAMTVGIVTLGLAFASGDAVAVGRWRSVARPTVWALPVLVAVLLTGGSWLVNEGLSYRERVLDVRARGTQSQHACNMHPSSPAYGDLDLIQGFIKTYRPMFRRAEAGIGMTAQDEWIVDAYLCSLGKRAPQSKSPALHLGLETFRSQLANEPVARLVPRKYREELEDWPSKLAQMLNSAPNRKDMTVGFFSSQMTLGNWRTAESLARALIDSDSRDPVGHWFLGLSLLAQGRPAVRTEGFGSLDKAISLGIQRILPVPPEIEAQIRAGNDSG